MRRKSEVSFLGKLFGQACLFSIAFALTVFGSKKRVTQRSISRVTSIGVHYS
jgi:hypothetical protein